MMQARPCFDDLNAFIFQIGIRLVGSGMLLKALAVYPNRGSPKTNFHRFIAIDDFCHPLLIASSSYSIQVEDSTVKNLALVTLAFFLAGAALADEPDKKDEEAVEKEAVEEQAKAAEVTELTAAERKAAEDPQVAGIVDDYNETVDDDLDEVVCKKQRVTGSRRTVLD